MTYDGAGRQRLLIMMLRIRAFEERAAAAFAAREIPGPVHIAIGQEAVAAGACSALRDSDYITSTHRGHHHCLAKGADPHRMFAELLGRRTGYGRGRGGSMHIADPERRILGANGIVGAGIPIGTGAGLAERVRGADGVALTFFGEGAVAEGSFHESLNLAALWRLPVIYLCENNLYAELTPMSVHLSAAQVVDFAAPYGIVGLGVDGNDAEAVRDAVEQGVERARDGGGPTLIEARTYRRHGHYEGDPQTYRTKEEREAWKLRDPIAMLATRMMQGDELTEKKFEDYRAQCEEEMKVALEQARREPQPRADDLMAELGGTR